MKRLLPSNATQLELAIDTVISNKIGTVYDNISRIWWPEQCPSELLPWLAWAVTVDAWDSNWLETVKRRVIAESFAIHQKKGTRWAVERLLSIIGHNDVEIVEWWQTEPKGTPHTFYMQIQSSPGFDPVILSENQYEKIRSIVNQVKPVRSHYRFSVSGNFAATEPPVQTDDEIGLEGSSPAEAGISIPSFVLYRDAKTISKTVHHFAGDQISAFSATPTNLLKKNFFVKPEQNYRWNKHFRCNTTLQPFMLKSINVQPMQQLDYNWMQPFSVTSNFTATPVTNTGVIL